MKRSEDGTKQRKTAKTGKKGRTTVPKFWHRGTVPCRTAMPPWHGRVLGACRPVSQFSI